MTPNDENMKQLEDFLTSTKQQTKDEALKELASHGVDIPAFKTRVASIVRKGYQQQARLAAEQASRDSSSNALRLFGDLLYKSKDELVAIFEQVRSGVFGIGRQQAALARCRNLQGGIPSEAELRSWLEDISATESQ